MSIYSLYFAKDLYEQRSAELRAEVEADRLAPGSAPDPTTSLAEMAEAA